MEFLSNSESTSLLGMVILSEEREITRLVQERLAVDWVKDEEDPRWEYEDALEALREFQNLNSKLYALVETATTKFQGFLETAIAELEPYGLSVHVNDPKMLSLNPVEWVSPEFEISVEVVDTKATLFHPPTQGLLRFRVDTRMPVAITEEVNSVSFMAYSDRDNQLTPGNLLIQALYPQTHLDSSDFEVWREARLETIHA